MPRIENVNRRTLLTGLIVLGPLLAMLAWSFHRGLDLSDEVSYVYLFTHPGNLSPVMDHFVWGHVLGRFTWTIVGLRFLTAVVLLSSSALLGAAVWVYLARRAVAVDVGLCILLPMLGTLLYFTGLRPTFSYSATLVASCNVFAAALLWMTDCRTTGARVGLVLVMGAMMALAWLARFAITLPMILVFLLFAGIQTRRWGAAALQALAIVGVMLAVLGLLWLAGCDLNGQYRLLRAIAGGSHDPVSVIGGDLVYGAILAATGLAVAAGLTVLRRLLRRGFMPVLACLLAVLAVGVLLAMTANGDFSPVSPSGALVINPPLRSLGPPTHAGALALLFFQGAAWLADRWPVMRRWVMPEADPQRAGAVLPLAFLLYVLSLLPEVGTNTGLWHRSVLSMGALFLMFAIFLPRGRGWLAGWMASLLLLWLAVPVTGVLVSNLVTRPFRIDGSNFLQTVRLTHPRELRGLLVSPNVAALQAALDRALDGLNVNRAQVPMLYGTDQPGIAALAGARILGAPWYYNGYPGWETWNCVLARSGVRTAPPLIVGIDVAQLGPHFPACLADYDFGPPVADADGHPIRLLRRRS